MPSPEVLEFAKLLAPISAEKPTGSDIRADTSPISDYQKIREGRKAARAAENHWKFRPTTLSKGAESLRRTGACPRAGDQDPCREIQGPGNRGVPDRGAGPSERVSGSARRIPAGSRADREVLGRTLSAASR